MPAPAVDALPSERPARVYHRVRLGLIALVVVIGGASTAAAWSQGADAARRDDMAVTRRAVDLVNATAMSTQAGLAGAAGLVGADGQVGIPAFTAYAEEVTQHSSLTTLAFEPVVLGAQRAAFERLFGHPIIDRQDEGFGRAPDRPVHYPVEVIVPVTAVNRVLLGFDLAGDAVRRAAAEEARDTGDVVFTAPTASQPSGTISFFIVKPLYRVGRPLGTVAERRAAIAGFISTSSVGTGLVDSLTGALPRGTRFQVVDGGVTLAASTVRPADGITREVRAAGRTWTITVDGPARADHGVAVLIALLTLLVAGGLLYVLLRGSRHDRDLRRSAELIARTADLAQALSAATTVEGVADVIQQGLSAVLDAPAVGAATSIGVIEGEVLHVLHGASVPDEYQERYASPPLSAELAFTEAARTGTTLLFEDQATYDARYPAAGGPKLGARAVLPLRRADGRTIGAMAHLWPTAIAFEPALVATLSTIAQLTGQAIERTRLAQRQADDTRHTEGLARLASGLASRTNGDALMAFLTRGVLAPLDAFHAAVGVVDGKVLQRHFSPGELSDLVSSAMPAATPLEADSPLTQVARLGEPVLLPDEAALRAGYPHLVDAWLAVGFGATANVPLRDRQGAVIGALGVAWDHPVVFDRELRDRLSTVAGIAGQTLERAQLVDRIRAEARGYEALADLAEVLATARSSDEVLTAVAGEAAPVLSAQRALAAVVDPASGLLRIDGRLLPRDVRLPHADVVTSGGTLTFTDLDALALRFPVVAAEVGERGHQAFAVTALRNSSGRRVGALAFEWGQRVVFDASRITALRNVADLVSQALERAQLSDAEHRLTTTLQDSVLAPLPEVEGLASAARYLPAARSVGMGGDWYEGMVLADGRYLVVVGDVAGHGITAVGQMAQFRSVIGALARLGTPLDDLFPLATSVVQGIDPIASALAAEIDVAAGVLRYSAAGHPPPLLRRPDGQVVVLDQGRQSLLGVPMPARPAGEAPFPPGSALVCYTDGLIERRGEPIDESVRRLAAIVASLPAAVAADPGRLADALLRTCLPDGDQTDDVAVAVIGRRLEPGPDGVEVGR